MFTTQNKRITVSVINDLTNDSRVKRTCEELVGLGCKVTLVGRKLPSSMPIKGWNFETKRMVLLFKKGVPFYVFFHIRLFFYLLFKKTDLLYANDLDTLWPNYLASKLKGIPLIYDSHEIFCEVPELMETPLKKRIWEGVERRIVPKLKYCITVNQSIATYFKERYGVNFKVVRNISVTANTKLTKSKSDLGIKPDKKMLVLQGAGINIQRGAEELVMAMKYLNNVVLYIIGGGDVWLELKRLVKENRLEERVIMIDRLAKDELMNYTSNADLGISIDKDTNMNYRYSLPNKIFDYINAGIPILASRLTEIERIIKQYKIGDFIHNHEPEHIAERITCMLESPEYNTWKANTELAKRELNWEEERKVLINLVRSID